MASITSSSAASSSTPRWEYDVFVSFCGQDTRRNFTDYLYNVLVDNGIVTYIDDEELGRGKTIRPELLKAIEESRFAVVVFSKNYASSTWCLDEVLKIAECQKEGRHNVFPIFYHVEPSEVRKQTGAFETAFAKHEEVFKDNLGKVKKWREALAQIADASGWDLQNRYESTVVKEIVETISKELNLSWPIDADEVLVGMDCRMEKMLSYLDLERSDGDRIFGIWGMGGIGKTTLAREVFNKIKDRFHPSWFVEDVREKYGTKVRLQKSLYKLLLGKEASDGNEINIIRNRLRERKVLIILDDVDESEIIQDLADLGAPGSRIIVTTRNKHVLGYKNIFEVDKLNEDEALQLLWKKAFKSNHPADEYKNESREVVKYANGLPLALNVLGSFLHGRTQEEWSATLASLKEYPEKGIKGPLRESRFSLVGSFTKVLLLFTKIRSMASITSSSAASSSNPEQNYDVFLSCSAQDTRRNFADYLYNALVDNGIVTYRDGEELVQGKTIRPELLKAIEESRFAIVVFSKSYASSTWCLDEVLKIAECQKEGRQSVLPIFYHVEPSEVRKQTGAFEMAFAKHEEVFKDNLGKVKKWREALTQIANVSGWCLQNRHESTVVKEIVETISKELILSCPIDVDEDLVGMDCRMEKMLSYLDLERRDADSIFGIWGMAGIGKTTLARVVFNKIKDRFHKSCFVRDVRENYRARFDLLRCLYESLLESKPNIPSDGQILHIMRYRLQYRKVLIILDDVDESEIIQALADLGAPGSRIIVTTRNKYVLRRGNIFEVEKLTKDEALQLFCKKAFKSNHPEDDYKDKSRGVVKYVNGLPLALNVLGSFLHGRNQEEWSATLASLKEYPEKGIMGDLRVSYDGLLESQRETFLDIACFFKGEDEFRVENILDKGHGFYSRIDILVLEEKSLITIVGGKIWMHDLLQGLGRQIVREEAREEPGKRTRLSLHKDVLDVLKENSGTSAVEGIFLMTPKKEEVRLDVDPFPKMNRLRVLKILNVEISGCLGYLSNELRLLEWHRCPLTSMPSSFQPNKLVELNLSNSCIKQLWEESKDLPNLVVINLTNCHLLMKTPDFSKIQNLEKLILKGCRKLSEVDKSIRDLKRLILLNLEGCESLEKLPHEISLESLEALNLSGCSKMDKFPEIVGKMEKLSQLHLAGTAIAELPMSIKHLTGLTLLNLKDCKNLLSLPDVICHWTLLKTLILSGCSRLDQLPNDLGSLKRLKELYASETSIRKVPSSIGHLTNLETLSLRGCKGHMPLPNRSTWLSLICCCLLPSEESESMSSSLELPLSLAGLSALRTLDLSRCNIPERGVPDLGLLSLLEKLDLSENNFTSAPQGISRLSKLRELSLNRCNQLESLPNLPSSIRNVSARECSNVKNSYAFTTWTSKDGLCVIDCGKSGEDKGTTFHKIPIAEEHVHLQMQKRIEDRIHQGKRFGHEFPYTRIPSWCPDDWASGSSITIELPPELDVIEWMGFALFVGYMSQKQENSDPPPPGDSFGCDITEISCLFQTVEGPLENSLDFHRIIDRNGGSLGQCHYVPRKWFAGQLDKVSQVELSFSTNSQAVVVTECGAHILCEQHVTKFVQKLVQSSEQAMAFSSHYQET